MKWIICLGILATLASHVHAAETWDVDSDSLRHFEANLLAFETLLINGDTKRGEARLIEALLDERSYSEVRIAAIDGLTRWSPVSPEAREALLEVISTETDVLTCRHAISKLKESGVSATDAIPVLLRAAGDTRSIRVYRCSELDVSSAALCAIEEYGDEAMPAMDRLVSIAQGRSPGDSHTAQHVLGRLAPWDFPFYCHTEAAIRPLALKLTSRDPAEALAATKKLLDMHTMAEPAVPELEQALDYGDDELRLTSAVALLAISPFHLEAQQVFAAAAEKSRGFERQRLFYWVEQYNLPYHETPLLLAMLTDSEFDCRVTAARKLGSRQQHEERALATLVDLYNEGTKSEKTAVIRAMCNFRPEVLAPVRGLVEQASTEKIQTAASLLRTKFQDRESLSAAANP